nr:DUF2786 domain-containing protein [Rhizobium phage RHph_TM26]
MNNDLSEEQVKIVQKVEKLLALANRKKGNEAEAAVAAAKAQEMLAAYNIDMAMVEQSSGSSGRREDVKHKGGVYLYQRALWRAVAELNFCLYWTSTKWVSRDVKKKAWGGDFTSTIWSIQYQHRVVGRTVNVKLTQSMASYLEQTIERLVMERLGNQNNLRFSRWAVSYRKGAAARIIEKVQDRRDQLEAEEAERKRAAEHAAARAGVSTATTLTLSDVRKSEREANLDHIHGEGYSTRQAARRAEAAAEAAKAEAEHAAWAAANPEEARKAEEKARKEDEAYWARRRGGRRGSIKESNIDSGAYWAGYDAAQKVGIDPQASDRTTSAPRLK